MQYQLSVLSSYFGRQHLFETYRVLPKRASEKGFEHGQLADL